MIGQMNSKRAGGRRYGATRNRISLTKWGRQLSAVLIVGTMVFSVHQTAEGQQIANTLGGFSSNPDAPIDIEADRLDVDDVKKTAVFKGSVKAIQGDFVLRSRVLTVYYSGEAGGANGGAEVRRLEAAQEVFITSRKDQTATSDWAKFDVKSQIVTIGGNVVLTQGKNVIKGERLVVDLNTGQSHFENPGIDDSAGGTRKGGRIRMLITRQPKSNTPQKKSANPLLRGTN